VIDSYGTIGLKEEHPPVDRVLTQLEAFAMFCSGGRWRVVSISDQQAVVDLCTCTGEPMERLESDDPAVIAHLRSTHSRKRTEQLRAQGA
jgi:hypothetical protein